MDIISKKNNSGGSQRIPEREEQPERTLKNFTLPNKKGRILKIIFISIASFSVILLLLFFRFEYTFSIINSNKENYSQIITKYQPTKEDNYIEKNRLDILLMGIRGSDDPNGGMLTDTIMVLSYNTETKKAAIISVPRDLYLKIPGVKKDKINAAYVYGEEVQRGFGLQLAKITVGYSLGIDIDHAILVDFSAFQKLIDAIGGIDVYTASEFRETQQWQGMDIHYEKGWNHLNGEEALYYSRARFMSNDFERARRQQEIMVGLKNKLLSPNMLADPNRIFDILKIIENNVRMDLDRMSIMQAVSIIGSTPNSDIKKYIIKNGESGFLYQTTINGAYVLLPKNDTFKDLRDFIRNILN